MQNNILLLTYLWQTEFEEEIVKRYDDIPASLSSVTTSLEAISDSLKQLLRVQADFAMAYNVVHNINYLDV